MRRSKADEEIFLDQLDAGLLRHGWKRDLLSDPPIPHGGRTTRNFWHEELGAHVNVTVQIAVPQPDHEEEDDE